MGMPCQIMDRSDVLVNVVPGSIRHDMCKEDRVQAIMTQNSSLRDWL